MSSQPAQDRYRYKFILLFSWPDLVGKDADEAVRIIKEQNPSLNVVKLGEVFFLMYKYIVITMYNGFTFR